MIFQEDQKQLEKEASEFLLNKSLKERIPKNLEDLGIN